MAYKYNKKNNLILYLTQHEKEMEIYKIKKNDVFKNNK